VLTVNAFTDEHRPTLLEKDLLRLRGRLAEHVRRSRSDLGVLLEPGGEIAHLVDDRGREVGFDQALLAFAHHEAARGAAVAVPVSTSLVCERLVKEAGGRLLWTPTAWSALMSRASRPEVGFAGNSDGALIFPQFMPAPDALMTFCKTLELVATAGCSLGELVDKLPPVHIARREVRTPWQLKGAVMRRIASLAVPGRLMLLDGVKVIQDDRWVLVIPHPDEPLCRVWSEAPTLAEAEEASERMAARIAAIVEDAA
jgi:mannose-1-phosphate guanylyltransferase/phosphomannomutase